MKKIPAFITTGVENVIPVLEAVSAAADAFPPLKSAVGGALWIHNAYTGFKSNQEEWKAFGEYVAQAVACVSADVSRSGNPAHFDQALEPLASTLDEVVSDMKKVPELQATNSLARRAVSFLKDRDKIPALEKKLNRSLSNFNLGTTVDARNELAKIFANTEGLVAGVSIVASNVKRLDENSTLRQLKCADGSSWNKQKTCQDGTRSDLLAKLEDFASARDPSSAERVLLLTGVAGCGKTAIAQSFAERLSKQKWPSATLGACFNFSAQVEDRRTTKLLFTTIAFFLSAVDQRLEARIVDALSSDKTLPAATLVDQFDGLIRLPLSTLPVSPPHPIVFILDALDEISDEAGLKALLTLLANDCSRLPASCRVIVTSRPDPTIIHRLESTSLRHIVRRQIEHRDSASLSDLRLVAHAKLEDIRIGRNMESRWLEPDLEERFVQKAAGLFVWVDVACKAIGKSAHPSKELHRLLAGDDTQEGMNELYVRILGDCPWKRKTFSSNYHVVLGTIVALKTPLSASAIHQLIGSLLKAGGDLEDVLEPLASVLLGVSTLSAHSSPSRPLEISHESFREFVTIAVPEDKQKYAVNELEASQRLALPCLSVLNGELPLHAEMLQEFFKFPLLREGRAIPSPIDGVVSEALGYACDHWMGHLSVVTTPTSDLVPTLRQFLRTNLVPWMKLCASRGQFHGVNVLQTWLDQRPSDVQIDFASEVDLDNLAQCLEAVQNGLAYMQRLEEALTACHLWVVVERQLINRDPTRLPDDLGRSLNNVSNRLSDLGRREEALVAVEEAVKIRRQLATDQPAAFNPNLALSLNNLSLRLSDLGQRREALVAIEEAVKIYCQLATDQPAAFNPDLASSFNSLSNRLSELGQREEALAAIKEAVNIYHQLATDRPAAFNPDLALSLNNLSLRLSDLGQQQEALVAIKEAVKICRQLATDQPVTFNPHLAMSLNNLSNHLSDLGQREEALVAIEEAVKIRRQLATDRPAASNPGLAMSLNNLSNHLSDLGQRQEALVAIEEAVKIYRQEASERPTAFNPRLANSLDTLASCLSDAGQHKEAVKSIQEAVALQRQLVEQQPAAFTPHLVEFLKTMAGCMFKQGDTEEALGPIAEAVILYRELASRYPARFKPDLADALGRQADYLAAIGREAEAELARAEQAALM